MSAAEDQSAVDKVLAGDTSAFEDLVRRWQGPLVNLAYRFCRDRGRAEEMPRRRFSEPIARLTAGAAKRLFRHGSSRWPRTCTAPNSGGFRCGQCHSMPSPNQGTLRP